MFSKHYSVYLKLRPGQGFWVYGILGLFISGILYFLGQNSGIKYLVFPEF